MRALDIGATGMLAQQRNVDVISNNIANMNTTAFKKQKANFQDLIYQDLRRVGTNSSDAGTIVPTGIQLGSGVKLASVYRVLEQGDVNETGKETDILINGRGYFQIELPDGRTGYTRDGSFEISSDSVLVTHDGYPLQPSIQIPAGKESITINQNGEVLVKVAGQVTPVNAGTINTANFANENGLESIGQNLFVETESSGAPQVGTPGSDGFGGLLARRLETSNVNVVSEITDLIRAQRAYEMNSKIIETADQMSTTTSRLR